MLISAILLNAPALAHTVFAKAILDPPTASATDLPGLTPTNTGRPHISHLVKRVNGKTTGAVLGGIFGGVILLFLLCCCRTMRNDRKPYGAHSGTGGVKRHPYPGNDHRNYDSRSQLRWGGNARSPHRYGGSSRRSPPAYDPYEGMDLPPYPGRAL